MKTATAVVIAGFGVVLGSAAVFALRAPVEQQPPKPIPITAWTEAKWPFPIDQWGTGRAFVCTPADCGTRVDLYIRPKIGYCNCATGVSDDAELERVADTELVSPKIRPRAAGRPIKVGWMKGLSRAYWASDDETSGNLLSVAFNDECDVMVALANLGKADPGTLEPGVMAFLNSNDMVLWAKKELGLEFIRRDW